MTRHLRIVFSIAAVALICGTIGCTTFQMPFGKKIQKATAANPAVEMLCLWQHGEGQDPDGRPCKGFSGQILFLSRTSSTPLKVEGEVRIDLYDDQGKTEEEKIKPLHRFEFDKGTWDMHFGKSSLGPAYLVFIPYTRHGTKDANCSLRVRLKPTHGPTIYSEFTNMPLNPNKKPQRGDEAKPITTEEVDRMAADELAGKLRQTTTISMSPNAKVSPAIVESNEASKNHPIQQAGYQVTEDPIKSSLGADKIREIELKLHQLLEQQRTESDSASSVSNNPNLEPARLDEESAEPRERLKLKPRRKVHPVNDETPRTDLKSRKSHPLDEQDADAVDQIPQGH